MSAIRPPTKGPKRIERPVARLDSLKNPQPRPPPQSQKPRATNCPNPECGLADTGDEEDGKVICRACGTVIHELNMVSDLQYGLSAGGQHVVHGFHVGAGEASARRGDVVDPHRTMTSRMVTESNGRRYIAMISTALNMAQHLRDAGLAIFKLAIGGFIQGRRIKSVAAVALYIACRTQKDTNTHMLIDFADVLEIDVFQLGNIYKQLLGHIRLNGTGWIVQPINPEDLILRFCQRLEFGSETMKVAKDAVRIVQRMNRDWMTPGRRPAGICGAALILAARMNNFRRTVREVVYVVKVQEQTIFARLEEFKVTESSGLTVDEFRTIDLERYADPPIFAAQKGDQAGKKKRRRKLNHLEFDDDGDNDQPTVISSRASPVTPSVTSVRSRTTTATQQQAQKDTRNMPPPPLPIDPNLVRSSSQIAIQSESPTSQAATEPMTEDQSNAKLGTENTKVMSEIFTKRKRGRKAKAATSTPVTPPATQLTDDPALEADITAALTNPSDLDHANALTSAIESMSSAQQEPSDTPMRDRLLIPNSEEISESEFQDDPEVSNCLLSDVEVKVKTRIWTHDNRDYLRLQSAKMLRQKLAEENGTGRTIVKRTRKRKRMGDMTAYLDEGEEEGRPVAGSPADAVMRMMGRRAYSRKVNYGMLNEVYGAGSSGSSTRRGSASIASHSPGGGGLEVSGALSPPNTLDQSVQQPLEKEAVVQEEVEDAVSEREEQDEDVQQEELNTIAGAVDEGIDDDDEEAEGYDDDPYEAAGDDSD